MYEYNTGARHLRLIDSWMALAVGGDFVDNKHGSYIVAAESIFQVVGTVADNYSFPFDLMKYDTLKR